MRKLRIRNGIEIITLEILVLVCRLFDDIIYESAIDRSWLIFR